MASNEAAGAAVDEVVEDLGRVTSISQMLKIIYFKLNKSWGLLFRFYFVCVCVLEFLVREEMTKEQFLAFFSRCEEVMAADGEVYIV